MVVYLKLYDKCKYDVTSKVKRKIFYNDVKKFEVIGGDEAILIEEYTDRSGIDEYHEYLRLTFENGDTSTFRNSHVDCFLER